MKNIKTTAAGIGAILAAIGGALYALFDNNPSTNVDLTVTISTITVGIGLIMAKDAIGASPSEPPKQ